MKKLTLVRHAKSSWKHDVIDHQRPLNNRGKVDVELVSRHLASNFGGTDFVLISDAVRAKNTALVFVENLKINKNIVHLSHDLYDFSGMNLLRVIKACSNSINNLMVFGHNHAITSFVNSYGDKFIENVPTCGVVIIEFNIEKWEDLNKGRTIKTVFPKDLKK